MKTVIIYKSKAGFTKKYAEWIAEELKADIFEASKVKGSDLIKYDNIIYGGGLYVVGINGIDLIKKNLKLLQNKKIIVFATGATPYRAELMNEIREKNLSISEQEKIRLLYLRGGFDYVKLGFFDKALITILKLKLKAKKKLSPDEFGMLSACYKPVDFTNHAKAVEFCFVLEKLLR